MLGNVTNVYDSMSAYIRHRSSASEQPAAPSVVSRDTPLDIRIIEPPSVARLYLSNGLKAGDDAPGGTGNANRIQMNGEDIAVSGKPIYPVAVLPTIPERGERLIEKMNKSREDKEQESRPVSFSGIAAKETIGVFALGGTRERAISAYLTLAESSSSFGIETTNELSITL